MPFTRRLALVLLIFAAAATARAETPCVPETVLPDNYFPIVRVETSMGAFDIELNRMRASITANNFLKYVIDGHFDGTIFHRVVADFVVQGGGYTRDIEEKELRCPIPNESGNGLQNLPMTVAMARYDDPHTATAQWFVNLKANASLDPSPSRWGYAVFGAVVQGQDVVEAIGAADTGYSEALDATDVPQVPIVIERAYVLEP